MSLSQYCFSWNSYKNNITNGFCYLQQNSEFVDMTLAAEGHFVKVHQNIMALASPYLKQILQSAPCPHPIIFLTNISNNVLSYLLEYIYIGEVNIPKDEVTTFIEACKVLHISGVEKFILPKNVPTDVQETFCNEPAEPPDNYAAHITINAKDYHLEVNPMENNYKQANLVSETVTDVGDGMNLSQSCPIENSIFDPENVSLNTELNSLDEENIVKIKTQKNKLKSSVKGISLGADAKIKVSDGIPQYSISNRGSVQLLCNRYLYHCHHRSHEGRKRRWRCIEYRKMRCPATIDTDGEIIINRAEVHSHPYHDNKILKKIKQKSVFTSLSIAEEKNNELLNKEKYHHSNEEDILF